MNPCAGCGVDLTFDTGHDEEACKKAHQSFLALGVGQAKKAPSQKLFGLTVVSQGADNKIADLEAAYATMASAVTHQQKEDAYVLLCQCRKALYTHIEELEILTKRNRTVKRRF